MTNIDEIKISIDEKIDIKIIKTSQKLVGCWSVIKNRVECKKSNDKLKQNLTRKRTNKRTKSSQAYQHYLDIKFENRQ